MSDEQAAELAKNCNMPGHPRDCELLIVALRAKGIVPEWHERAQRLIRECKWAKRKVKNP